MRSKKAEEYVYSHHSITHRCNCIYCTRTDLYNDYFSVEELDHAIELAESEMIKKAVQVFAQMLFTKNVAVSRCCPIHRRKAIDEFTQKIKDQ